MLLFTGLHMEAGILVRNVVSHAAFKGARVDERHGRQRRIGRQVETSKLLNQHNSDIFSYIGSRGLRHTTLPCQQPTIPPFMITTHHIPMIHVFPLFPMHSVLYVSHLYVFPSIWLIQLTNTALVCCDVAGHVVGATQVTWLSTQDTPRNILQ